MPAQRAPMSRYLEGALYKCSIIILSVNFLRYFSLAVAGPRAPLSRFLEEALYKYPE